jgi:hypothetical protein
MNGDWMGDGRKRNNGSRSLIADQNICLISMGYVMIAKEIQFVSMPKMLFQLLQPSLEPNMSFPCTFGQQAQRVFHSCALKSEDDSGRSKESLRSE